ncbi:glycosyltransferase family 4 protein [Micromonospora sp. KC213]|uniref:glycosyltransferase family 4 protein n=1 Tax=Micromonospora sp. KC213 TaxID=2530378 RepID=UPI001FB767DC|nr:glycosyltransferase family 4 protein [Micromonospora sp. KC213]
MAVVSPVPFPWGLPGSRRVFGLTGSLAAAGYDVVVGSGGAEPSSLTVLDVDGPGSVTYVGLGEMPPAGSGLIDSSVQMFLRWGRRTVRWLDDQPTRPTHVLVHGGFAQYMVHLRRWCRRHQIPLIADVVDWYNGRYVRGGYFGPLHLSMKAALRHYYARCDGVIAISTFLEDHYRNRGRAVLRVPPTLDVEGMGVDLDGARPDASGLSLVYAGTPGRNNKDLLVTIIEAVSFVDPQGDQVELRVFGPSVADVRGLLGGAELPPGVRALGRIPQEEIPRELQKADFSILLRRPERANQAGFSTKFCESMANGTPVIANITSDLGRYLHHGVDGLVCRDHSVGALVDTLRWAMRLSVTERRSMRKAARAQALESFDYRAYAESLGAFLAELRR